MGIRMELSRRVFIGAAAAAAGMLMPENLLAHRRNDLSNQCGSSGDLQDFANCLDGEVEDFDKHFERSSGRLKNDRGRAFSGELVHRTKNYAPGTGWVPLEWNYAKFNTPGMWDSHAPDVLKVPANVAKVRVSGNVHFEANSAGLRGLGVTIGGQLFAGRPAIVVKPGGGATVLNISSNVLEVSAGQEVRLTCFQTAAANLEVVYGNSDAAGFGTWFAMEIIEWN